MAINDTGYELTIGPDKNGQHFTVAPGAEYEIPEPLDSEPAAAAAPADEPVEDPAPAPKPSKKTAPPPTDTTEPATGDTQKG